jgi:carotenoid cleavage dioxygenase-like enzyme
MDTLARSLPTTDMLSEPATPAARLETRAPFRSRAEDGPLAMSAELEGELPAWLAGDLLRTAPAVFQREGASGRFDAAHWFDALGLLYGFRIEGGAVRFRQRLMETEVERASRDGGMPTASFGSPIVRSFWRRLFSPIPKVTDNTNVNLVPLGDQLVALTESPHQWRIDRESLATTERVTYDDEHGALTMIAHPHFDFQRGKIVNVATEIGPQHALVVYEHAPNERKRRIIGKVKVKRLPYVHAFGLTPKHAVLIGHPFDINGLSMLWSNRGFIDHFRYRPEQGTTLWLLDRATGEVRTHVAPSGFVFHVVNAFEDGEKTVLDVALHPDASVVASFRTEHMQRHGLSPLAPSIVRYTMTPGREHAEVETLLEHGFEFPTVSYKKRSGQRHQLAWGARIEAGGASEVLRLDASGQVRRFVDPDFTFGEPIFVAQPGTSDEGAGVLLTVGSHRTEARSQLAVIDADTMAPIARAEVPLSIPLGFHGSFVRS